MKQLLILFVAYLVMIKLSFAQNIGIGTVLPGAKLQINHRTTASSPTLRLFDSTAGTGSSILFTKESQTNTFSIISTNSTFAADNTLDFRTTFNSGFLLRGDGRVGINNITNPAATLHVGGGVKINDTLNVAGDVNISGKLKLNGNNGADGQVLVSRGASASPVWTSAAASYPANERAWLISNTVNLTSPAFADTIDISMGPGINYNTSSAIINSANNTITITKPGLYRFEGTVSIQTSGPSDIIRGNHHTCGIKMRDDDIDIHLAYEAILERDISFSERKIRFSVDRYIDSGSVIWFFADVKNIASTGGASIIGNEETYISFYLIAE